MSVGSSAAVVLDEIPPCHPPFVAVLRVGKKGGRRPLKTRFVPGSGAP